MATKRSDKTKESSKEATPSKTGAASHQTSASSSKTSHAKGVLVQPAVNIGLFGHVDHGKTTLVKALSGKWTDTHSEEIKRGITIRLGYADATIYKCPSCEGVDGFGVSATCKNCKGETAALRTISLIDAPGHESLMATMLAGATIIDGALLLVSAHETCPQPQTKEHLMALEILGVTNVIVVQNKVDLVSEAEALKNQAQIKAFLKGTAYENAPIIPISAQHNINIDALLFAIEEFVPTPDRDMHKDPIMLVARSFDINKPGSDPQKLVGGIIGGMLRQGKLSVGQEIEMLPGYMVEEKNRKVAKPLRTKIVGIMTGGQKVDSVVPGGSIAIATTLDPSIIKSDKLTGAVVGIPGKLPPVWYLLKLEPHLLQRAVGTKEDLTVEPIKMGEILMLNVNSGATAGIVTELSKKEVTVTLKLPVCADAGARVTISRRIGNRFRLIGFGILNA